MTPEPPSRPARRNRPDSAFRQRALGTAAPGGGPVSPPPRESFRQALSRIPDLGEPESIEPSGEVEHLRTAEVPAAAAPAAVTPTPGQVAPRADGGPLGARSEATATLGPAAPAAGAPPAAPAVELDEPATATSARGSRRSRTAPPPPASWPRRVAFAVVLVALVASIPGLGYAGYHLVSESTDGQRGTETAGPGDPGYEELVTSTPTALLIQNDAKGVPVNLTFLSLAGDAGGSVVFLPLDTLVPEPAFGIDRLRSAYGMVTGDHAAAVEQVAYQAASVLNVGIDDVFELDDQGWSRLVAPVAPLSIFNSDPLDLAGFPLPAGDTAVPDALVGPYFAATREGEDDTSRFPRQQELFQSWLAAVKASTKADAVPGETSTGIGRFIRTLAAGEVTYNTLPGAFDTTGVHPVYVPDELALTELVAEAVPAPDAAYPGSRTTVRLLNGVAAAPIPTEITSKVVAFKGTVTVVGNGPSFDRDKTSIVYADPSKKSYAELLLKSLGATGSVRLDREAPDNVDVTVVLGRDLLGDQQSTTTTTAADGEPVFTSSTTTTTAPGGT